MPFLLEGQMQSFTSTTQSSRITTISAEAELFLLIQRGASFILKIQSSPETKQFTGAWHTRRILRRLVSRTVTSCKTSQSSEESPSSGLMVRVTLNRLSSPRTARSTPKSFSLLTRSKKT